MCISLVFLFCPTPDVSARSVLIHCGCVCVCAWVYAQFWNLIGFSFISYSVVMCELFLACGICRRSMYLETYSMPSIQSSNKNAVLIKPMDLLNPQKWELKSSSFTEFICSILCAGRIVNWTRWIDFEYNSLFVVLNIYFFSCYSILFKRNMQSQNIS